jgi:hypothetical protein
MEKLMEKLETKIKEVSNQMEKKQEKLGTIPAEIWEMKWKLHDEFQVEECSFFSQSAPRMDSLSKCTSLGCVNRSRR